jgi:hypothetical protein
MIAMARNGRIGKGLEETRSSNYMGIALVAVVALVAIVLALFWSNGSMGGPWVFNMRPAATQTMAPATSGLQEALDRRARRATWVLQAQTELPQRRRRSREPTGTVQRQASASNERGTRND